MPVLKLPETIQMRAVMFGSLDRGGHIQTQENDEFKICVSNIKRTRHDEWKQAWTIAGVDKVFDSYKLLREHVNGQTDGS